MASVFNEWQKAQDILKMQLTDVAYNTYIKTLEPLYIKDDCFCLVTKDSFYKTTIEHRYISTVAKAVKSVVSPGIGVKILTMEDLDESRASKSANKSNIIPKYRFDNFVKGKSNELAYATAHSVSQNPGQTYNPLFLYGGVGLGKTHLMHSIGNYVLERNPDTKVLYCSAENFMNELITSIRQNKNQEFRDKYRQIDILLIDDIQFLSDKEGTQEEFFHTFNSLYNENKQIVISSDQPPKELRTLEDRLRSRFSWGVIVDITIPDFETRMAILEKKAEIDSIVIPKEVLKFIAKNIVSNIRDLEGALNKVALFSNLTGSSISQQTADTALKDILTGEEKPEITVEYIQQTVAAYFGITPDDLKSQKRTQNITYPRQIAMYLSRKLIDISLPKIGAQFGGRDHSTVIHGCDKITAMIENDHQVRNTVIDIEKKITD